MIIQTYQIQNVLRTYGHLDELKTSQRETETKQTEKSIPAAAPLLEEAKTHFKIQGNSIEADDIQRDE